MAFVLILLLSIFSSGSQPKTWQCANDLEIRCDGNSCQSQPKGEFTPMSVSFSDKGEMSVCAYTGCWEGTGSTSTVGDFLYITGTDMPFSTASDSKQNISIMLDKSDNIGMIKAGEFTHPVICTVIPSKKTIE